MSKKMLIDATHAEETRVVVVEGNKVEDFDFESLTKRQLAGNVYLAKVTRVEPSLQAAFVDYGGNRHGFLAFSEIHPDYYQIPAEDREKLLAEEAEYTKALEEAAEREDASKTVAKSAPEPTISNDDDVIDLAASEDPGLVDVPENGQSEAETPEPDATREDTSAPQEAAVSTDDDTSDNLAPENTQEPETIASEPVEIEDVADESVEEVVRPKKPRPRRYKIQEVIKVRQILLVQVVKEERGNKGAALTTYLSLAGRYCVLMPNTARGGGISRKITNADDRKKIKKITSELTVPAGAGLIVRTAGAKRTKTEILRDYEYLTRQWQQIRDTTMKSTAPCQIYAEGDLIKRSIRDLYSSKIDEVLVEGDRGFEAAQAYMTLLMPSHVKRVKKYEDRMPLFARYQVESYLDGMFNPTVQLKSGGYLVIGVTEALVAIDVNSGKSTKESSIEKTALKTNLEAAEEVARQLRLRDLAGLIVIDFIDMEERRNNQAVERKMKESLKTDRARIQVGGISGFGLMEMSRQRLRPGMIEATTAPCPHCHGTGIVRSPNSLALSIIREIEDEAMRKRSREISVAAPIDVVNYIMNYKRDHIAQIELQYGVSVIIEADAALLGSDYELEKHKSPTRFVPDQIEIPDVSDIEIPETEEQDEDSDEEPKKKRRRRRRGGRGRNKNQEQTSETTENAEAPDASSTEGTQAGEPEAKAEPASADQTNTEDAPKDEKPKRKRAPRKKKTDDAPVDSDAAPAKAQSDSTKEAKPEDTPAEEAPKKKRAPRKKKTEDKPTESEETPKSEDQAAEEKPKPKRTRKKAEPKAEGAEQPATAPTAEPVEAANDDPDKPKRKGWWSR